MNEFDKNNHLSFLKTLLTMRILRVYLIALFLVVGLNVNICAQRVDYLQPTLQGIVDKYQATIGFSVLDLENEKTYSVNGDMHLPMQSVYKFHLGLAVLSQVDQRKLSLDQKILIKKSDLLPDTWSPLRDKYPNGGVKIPLSELISFTVGQSDNNGCDILFRLLGGPSKVQTYIFSLGVQNIAIVATEEEMHKDEKVQFTNWATPNCSVQLLNLFYKRKVLSEKSHAFLWKVMTESTSGPKKIKGLLPPSTSVAHKTGYSGVNKEGVTASSNDIGIVTMPNGRHFAVAAFVSNTKENDKTIDSMIAELSKAAWDQLNN
ncbi:class A beta-lactamase, subclass A2 [Pedobacter sp. JCM 36344]|uniref:class A beta-lactamase, subclass A2 n=1 Tax=Pedobacter sp. JCM 36344 TaxID=3374280 RepID=UPI003979BB04